MPAHPFRFSSKIISLCKSIFPWTTSLLWSSGLSTVSTFSLKNSLPLFARKVLMQFSGPAVLPRISGPAIKSPIFLICLRRKFFNISCISSSLSKPLQTYLSGTDSNEVLKRFSSGLSLGDTWRFISSTLIYIVDWNIIFFWLKRSSSVSPTNVHRQAENIDIQIHTDSVKGSVSILNHLKALHSII